MSDTQALMYSLNSGVPWYAIGSMPDESGASTSYAPMQPKTLTGRPPAERRCRAATPHVAGLFGAIDVTAAAGRVVGVVVACVERRTVLVSMPTITALRPMTADTATRLP